MTREVEARLKISAVDKTGRTLKGVSDKMAEINKRAAAFNRQQTVLAKGSAAAFGAIARYAAPAAIAYGAKKALTDFAAIEREMNRIGITANASGDETKAAFSEIQTITKQLALGVDDGVTALDTLVASGMDLKEAMAFLPSVLATAQASGAATDDIANTAIKSASALKLETGQMQRAFDIMVAGGKAGQFELKDMATYIPDLANSFASLGYSGEDGLKKLVAILQTIREDTGSASSAATYAQNVFGKIYSSDTAQKFQKMGIDLRKEMAKAKKSGEDTVAAFVRISNKAIKGDLSKLPLLFTDEQFRLGMQSLMTSSESYKKFIDTVNDSHIDGTVMRDLQRVTGDTQASIDKLSSSWSKMMNSIGKSVAIPAVPVMNAISNDLDYGSAIRQSLGQQGKGYWETETWMAMNLPFGGFSHSSDADKMALQGGYKDPEFLKRMRQGPERPEGYGVPQFPGHRSIPVSDSMENIGKPSVPSEGGFFRIPSKDEFKNALKIDLGGDDAAQKVADGGKEAGKAIEDSAAFFKVAGYDVGAQISAAAKELAAAFRQGPSYAAYSGAQNGPRGVNADTGRSMPVAVNRPMNRGME